MLFLYLGTCQITPKIRLFRSGRFWGRLGRNSDFFDRLSREKWSRFDQSSRNCLHKSHPVTWRNFDVVLVCQTTVHHHREGGFEMVKQNEPRRVMITLSDQAIAKLDQLVAEKQRELNQNSELAKYNLRINKSNILEAMLSKNRTLKRKDWFFWLIQPSLEIFLNKI